MALCPLLVVALPPPPMPESVDGGGGSSWPVLAAAGLALVLLAAFTVGLLVERARAAGRTRRRIDPVVGRIELWDDGAAVVLGYAADPASGDPTFAVHLARARAEGRRGTLVLIDPVSDAIVALCPLQPEAMPPGMAGADDGTARHDTPTRASF